jgi:uncharacterized protein (DUF1684 family)
MKTLWFILMCIPLGVLSQDNEKIIAEIETVQQQLNAHYTNPETTVLKPEDFEKFEGLEFYPIALEYRVEATFVRTPDEEPFYMPTTTERLPLYVKYGELFFTWEGKQHQLDIFENLEPKKEEYKDYLFLPITDLTSGDGSYGGGRYLDVKKSEVAQGKVVLDFNKLYNPYCAYNEKYSCPIPPAQNDLPIRIEAGVKDFFKAE